MQKYSVKWTQNAQFDLDSIIEHIHQDSPTTAKNIFVTIKQNAKNLKTLPLRHRIAPELQELGIARYREIIYKRWRIVYRVDDVNVLVVAVLDTSRNMEDILFKRLLNLP